MAAGRPRSSTHHEPERIAFGLFATHGFDDTSVDDVAAAAGISRRTLFRYYASRNDIVWGDFGGQLIRLEGWLAHCDESLEMMQAIRLAVIDFNRVERSQLAWHRQQMILILTVPTLLAYSTLRFTEWRGVIQRFAARRLALSRDDLLPTVIRYSTLGASTAAYDRWLADPGRDLCQLLDQAFGQLAAGFADVQVPQDRARSGSRRG
jgi:mycofactocin system transcriptional regulator